MKTVRLFNNEIKNVGYVIILWWMYNTLCVMGVVCRPPTTY